MSNLTNDRDTENKILNDCQFTINIAINNELGHLDLKPIMKCTKVLTSFFTLFSHLK